VKAGLRSRLLARRLLLLLLLLAAFLSSCFLLLAFSFFLLFLLFCSLIALVLLRCQTQNRHHDRPAEFSSSFAPRAPATFSKNGRKPSGRRVFPSVRRRLGPPAGRGFERAPSCGREPTLHSRRGVAFVPGQRRLTLPPLLLSSFFFSLSFIFSFFFLLLSLLLRLSSLLLSRFFSLLLLFLSSPVFSFLSSSSFFSSLSLLIIVPSFFPFLFSPFPPRSPLFLSPCPLLTLLRRELCGPLKR